MFLGALFVVSMAGSVGAADITLGPLEAGATVVTGQAKYGMGIITIHDTSYDMPTPQRTGMAPEPATTMLDEPSEASTISLDGSLQ